MLYNERIMQVQHGSFTPLVILTKGSLEENVKNLRLNFQS